VSSCLAPERTRTLEQLVQQLIDLDIHQETLRGEILARMQNEGIARVDAAGGHVVYVKASCGTSVDQKALEGKLAQLGAELRALGKDPDDALPLKPTSRRAGLRVNLR